MLKPENFTHFSSYLLANEAEKRGIKVKQLFPDRRASTSLFIYKNREELLVGQRFSIMTAPAYWAAKNKDLTKKLLERAGIITPKGFIISRKSLPILNQRIKGLKYPFVVKPRGATHGKMVVMNVRSKEQLIKTIKRITYGGRYSTCVVEEQFPGGTEYRLFATNKKFLAAANRVPANVVGDGQHSIRELIKIKNSDPRRGRGHSKSLVNIKVDSIVKDYLKTQGLSVSDIPPKNKQIFLRPNSNLSTGGDSIDVTDKIHPAVKKLAQKCIQAIPGLPYAGIDYLTHDITKAPSKGNYIVIELNESPMLSMHHLPYQGKGINIAKEIIDMVFPETKGKYIK